jgi:predicted secreted protein
MQLFSYFAVYFIVWWMTLFAILPLGLKTQAEAEEVVPGTVESAPARFRGRRVVLLTTIVSALIYGAWYILSVRFGLGIDAIPQIMPDFK